jgi:hypothetical protein
MIMGCDRKNAMSSFERHGIARCIEDFVAKAKANGMRLR